MVVFESRNGREVTIDGRVLRFATVDHAELYELIVTGKVADQDVSFGQDLIRKPVTPNRVNWIKKLIARARQTEETDKIYQELTGVAPSKIVIDVSKIIDMFMFARDHLKKPKITLQLDNGTKVRFVINWERNRMYINSERFGEGFGSVNLVDNEVSLQTLGIANKDLLLKLLNEFAQDPKATAIMYGKLTGNCCFCSTPLKDARSLHQGYGPICARHYGMPWGDTSMFTAEAEWVINPVENQ